MIKNLKIFLLIFFLFFTAQITPAKTEKIKPEKYNKTFLTYLDCIKKYQIKPEDLFFITLAALTKNQYEVKEIEYKAGSILFKAEDDEFLVIVSQIDNQNTFIRILPTDNEYDFQPQLIENIYSYIDQNANSKLQLPIN
ncbi:MAG: hypothetical protein PHV37_02680 [Candidatus Gastranaerophilales bacterium]|nr:hypothetical protein [Candidatus Gastranaerophilales bacterium]